MPFMLTEGDLFVAARTVWGEARGESQEARIAVAHVMVNRVREEKGQFKQDVTLAGACTRSRQFSCWNPEDPNFGEMARVDLNSPEFRNCMAAVLKAVDSKTDPTFGSRHYHASYASPSWAEGHSAVAKSGNHFFYNSIL